MKVSEFKAFIEGIEEAFSGYSPNIRQWEKIKEKINRLESEDVKRVEWQPLENYSIKFGDEGEQ